MLSKASRNRISTGILEIDLAMAEGLPLKEMATIHPPLCTSKSIHSHSSAFGKALYWESWENSMKIFDHKSLYVQDWCSKTKLQKTRYISREKRLYKRRARYRRDVGETRYKKEYLEYLELNK